MPQGQVLSYQRLACFEAREQGLNSKFEHDPGLSAESRKSLNSRADE